MRVISLRGVQNTQALELSIGGVFFQVRFSWIERLNGWSVDFLDAKGAAVLAGRRLLPNWPLTNRYTGGKLPEGTFSVVRIDGSSKPFSRENLANEGLFVYLTPEDIEENARGGFDDFGNMGIVENV